MGNPASRSQHAKLIPLWWPACPGPKMASVDSIAKPAVHVRRLRLHASRPGKHFQYGRARRGSSKPTVSDIPACVETTTWPSTVPASLKPSSGSRMPFSVMSPFNSTGKRSFTTMFARGLSANYKLSMENTATGRENPLKATLPKYSTFCCGIKACFVSSSISNRAETIFVCASSRDARFTLSPMQV